jgi:hypothetical protein
VDVTHRFDVVVVGPTARHWRGKLYSPTAASGRDRLLAKLGCNLDEKGRADTGEFEEQMCPAYILLEMRRVTFNSQ